MTLAEKMTAFLADLGSVITMLLANIPKILQLFVDNPVLVVIFAIFVLGAVIGLVTRIYRHA